MRTSDAADLVAGARATVGAVFGSVGDLFGADGDTFDAVLSIDDDASVPPASLLRPGSTHAAVVQVGPDRDGVTPRKLCIKVPNASLAGCTRLCPPATCSQ